MSGRKTAIKDPFYRKIVEGLNEQSLNPTVFEDCMGDLLRDDGSGGKNNGAMDLSIFPNAVCARPIRAL